MSSKSKKLEIAIITVAVLGLITVWALNDYENTWLYVTAVIIAIPASWFSFSKKNKDQ